jgi:hypothetical protein
MQKLVVLLLLLFPDLSRADSVATVCNAAPNIKPILTHGACAGFIAHDASGREVNRVAGGYDVSGSIFASPDGRSVVLVQHYPELGDDVDKKDALIVFRDGKRIARYAIADVVQRMELTSESISHLDWTDDLPRSLVLGKTFRLTTTSQRLLTLDVAKGTLDQRDTLLWTRCELIAFAGKRPTPTGKVYTIAQPPIMAKGTPPAGSPFQYTLGKGVTLGTYSFVCLVKDGSSWLATDAINLTWNRL